MMSTRKLTHRVLVVGAAAVVALGMYANVAAAGGRDCPPKPKFCPKLWAPVICDDGKVYSNQCWADKRCATGCEPYDEGLGAAAGGRDCPPKPKFCPKLYAPVICDDGKVYPNQCWADKRCATGCEPYGDWLGVAAGGRDCPPRPKFCPRLWAPVICDDGKVYSNQCWADKRCATGCEPYDEGLGAAAGGRDCPPKPKFCPQLWAPVICDNGKVYPNQCWADKRCATGCEPYDEGLGAAAGGKKKPGDDDGCPRIGWVCPDVWDPVICDDGETYSNDCVAWVWCATGCESLGQGPIPLP